MVGRNPKRAKRSLTLRAHLGAELVKVGSALLLALGPHLKHLAQRHLRRRSRLLTLLQALETNVVPHHERPQSQQPPPPPSQPPQPKLPQEPAQPKRRGRPRKNIEAPMNPKAKRSKQVMKPTMGQQAKPQKVPPQLMPRTQPMISQAALRPQLAQQPIPNSASLGQVSHAFAYTPPQYGLQHPSGIMPHDAFVANQNHIASALRQQQMLYHPHLPDRTQFPHQVNTSSYFTNHSMPTAAVPTGVVIKPNVPVLPHATPSAPGSMTAQTSSTQYDPCTICKEPHRFMSCVDLGSEISLRVAIDNLRTSNLDVTIKAQVKGRLSEILRKLSAK